VTQRSATLPPPAHWSKDFVEHLRTVHFALIIVATGLIVIVLSAKPYDPAIALREIHQIIELKKMWSRDWLVQRGTTKYMALENSDPYHPKGLDLSTLGTTQIVGPPQPLLHIAERFHAQVLDKRGRSQGVVEFSVQRPSLWMQDFSRDWSPDTFPNTLADFQRWWEVLETRNYKAIFPLTASGTTGWPIAIDSPALLPMDEASAVQVKAPDRVSLSLGLSEAAPIYGGSGRFGEYTLAVVTFSYVEVSQENIVDQFKNWKVGSFDSSFADLSRATLELEGLEFDDVEKFISAEGAKGTEVFEAFGMKFPANQITSWGIVLLLGVQLYFFVYVKQLYGKLTREDAGWDVPWIGMDTFWLARSIFFLTIVLLPCVATGLLSGHAISRLSHPFARERWAIVTTGALVAAFIFTGVLGLSCWNYRPKIRETVASSTPQPEDPIDRSVSPTAG
jgi:hypothetical protein